MFKWPWKSRQKEPVKRYAAARLSRYVDFFATLQNAHRERLADLSKLRAHSRELRKDNVYAARYIELVGTNMVGPTGINFESELVGNQQKPKKELNALIEASFAEWGKSCTVNGRSWVESQQLSGETAATDGEMLVRLVRGYPNRWGFAIELIDADRLDHEFSQPVAGGRIIGGIEVDDWGRRRAYHLWTAHPDDYDAAPKRVRIPADQILHLYREDRINGYRGVPWTTPAMVQINMLGRLWTAELAAANHDADRLGVIKSLTGIDETEYKLDTAEARAQELSSEIAHFMALDANQDIIFPPSQHPNSVLPAFTAYLLKGVAASLGVAHHSLSGDLSESKFSSDRTALLQERDHWRKLQAWFIREFCDPIFRAWLEMALVSGALNVAVPDFERLYAPRWDARCWDWVDPQKDIEASIAAIKTGLATYQDVLGAQGRNWRDQFAQWEIEQKEAQRIGLQLTDTKSTPRKETSDGPEEPADPMA